MSIEVHLLPALKDNYIAVVLEPVSGFVLVVDPGEAGVAPKFLQTRDWQPSLILNTHHHWDHVGGNRELQSMYHAPLIASVRDGEKIDGVDRFVTDEERWAFGNETIRAISIPGHTLGHTAYYFENSQVVFTGDTLFGMGCGRLFEGTPEQMWNSLKRLMSLPDEAQVYCGHKYTLANGRFAAHIEPDNPAIQQRNEFVKQRREAGLPSLPSTIGLEKQTNPFLRSGLADMRWRLHLSEETPDHAVFARLRTLKDEFH
ncbi:MAG: hydroxyacylglutathione hydrolase [Bdellovibrionaceae bacterium]|nr:hydroxyacylglutathione hydrolase [Pseudobdellovibrionaceae bacterium]